MFLHQVLAYTIRGKIQIVMQKQQIQNISSNMEWQIYVT